MPAQRGSGIENNIQQAAVSQVMDRISVAAPQPRSRITGAVYLLYFIIAILGEFFMRQAGMTGIGAVPDNVAAMLTNLLANEPSFRLGFALSLLSIACYVALTALFYRLFMPVNRGLSLLAAFFSLMGLAIQTFGSVFLLVPLLLLGRGASTTAFTLDQLQELALLFLKLNRQAYVIGLVFDALFLLLIGYLILRATFLPRILGALLVMAGLGWLTYLFPPLASYLSPYNAIPGILGEGALMLWLLVAGVNVQRRQEQAVAAAAPGKA
jgi:uncharacterized protein DUF4386